MMMTVVIMFIENLPSNGRGNNSKQLAYCQSFPWNREAFQQNRTRKKGRKGRDILMMIIMFIEHLPNCGQERKLFKAIGILSKFLSQYQSTQWDLMDKNGGYWTGQLSLSGLSSIAQVTFTLVRTTNWVFQCYNFCSWC